MRLYKKKIRDYRKLIQGRYVAESSVRDVMEQSGDVIRKQEGSCNRISYFEFLYVQCKFIKKGWWGLQGGVLILLWFLLRDSGTMEGMERIMGILAAIFVTLIIPEIWKNRKFSAIEIERASFYSLRQVCAARTLLFAMVDFIMVMVFFMITYNTIPIPAYRMMINFLIPFNVSGCICFRLLYSKWMETEYAAILASMVWIAVWSAIVTHDSFYQMIVEPVWTWLILLSFGYLIFVIRKSLLCCEEIWEDNVYGTKA